MLVRRDAGNDRLACMRVVAARFQNVPQRYLRFGSEERDSVPRLEQCAWVQVLTASMVELRSLFEVNDTILLVGVLFHVTFRHRLGVLRPSRIVSIKFFEHVLPVQFIQQNLRSAFKKRQILHGI